MKQGDFLHQLGVTRHEAILKNGLKAVLYERPNAPVSLRMAFRSGSRYDPKGKEGLSHFVEHVVVAGTKAYPSKDLLAQYIEKSGGVFGATTSSEMLNVDVHVADVADLTKAAFLLDEMLNRSLFSEHTFKTERGSVERELGNRLSSPANILWHVYNGLFYQGSLVGRPVLGTTESVDSITLADAKDFFDTMLTKERAVLVAVGGVTMAEIKTAFGALELRSGQGPAELPPAKVVRKKYLDIKHFTINDQIDFLIGFRTTGFSNADEAALNVIQTILGGGRAATLMRKLRYEKGYIYGGGAMNYLYKKEGTWIFKSACSKKDLQDALDIITAEFRRVYEGGLTDDELDFAKNKILKSLKMQLQTSHDWIDFCASYEALVPKRGVNNYVHEIASLTPQQLAEVGQKYFQPGSWYLSLVGDIKQSDINVNY